MNRRAQQFWGLRYIDDPVTRRIGQGTSGWLGANDEAYFHITDPQFSTVAMIRASNAQLVERVSYTPYGVGTHRYAHDVNNDGAVTTSTSTPGTDGYLVDQLADANGGAGTAMVDGSGDLVSTYDVAADIDRSGTIDNADTGLIGAWGAKSALSAGMISDSAGPDNVIGYDGYVFAQEHRSYIARFRWYEPVLGRWAQRDFAGYFGGATLYEYGMSGPTVLNDAIGLAPTDPMWHHELPEPVQSRKIPGLNCNSAEYGKIFPPGAHSYDAVHQAYNADWEQFFKDYQTKYGDGQIPDKEKVLKQLDELRTKYADWYKCTKSAPVSYWKWNSREFDKAAELKKLFGEEIEYYLQKKAAAAAEKSTLKKLAGRTVAKIILPAFVIYDYFTTDKSFAECTAANASPIPPEVLEQLIEYTNASLDEFQKRKRLDVKGAEDRLLDEITGQCDCE